MYKEVYEYSLKNGLSAIPNSAKKEISAYINLDEKGQYIGIDLVDTKNRKKVNCPDIGSLAYAGNNTNPIVEKRNYIFDKENENHERNKKHDGWLSIMKEGKECGGIMSCIWEFISLCEEDDKILEMINNELDKCKIKKGDFISFRIDGIKAEENGCWKKWFDKYVDERANKSKNENPVIVSAITGKVVESVSIKTAPQVKAGVTGTGSYIVALGCPSFESYGLEGNVGASIGKEEAESIKAGLEYLLNDPNHYNNNFGIIHWYEDEDIEDLINESLNISEYLDDDDEIYEDRDEKLSYLLKCAVSGEKPEKMPSSKYTIAKFVVPTKGREYLSDIHTGSYEELFYNLCKWYADSRIEFIFRDSKTGKNIESFSILKNIYGLCFALMPDSALNSRDRYAKLDAIFGTSKLELLYSIYENRQIPRIFYYKALEKFKNMVVTNKNIDKTVVQVIKVYLVRMEDEESKMDKSKAYVCGQLFAVYEKVQNIANGNVKVNITQKYFGAVQKSPQTFYPKLAELSIIHLKKIKNEGTIIWLEKIISNLATEIGATFPKQFNDIEKGEFILGYYNQKNEMFRSKDTEIKENTEE